MKNKILLKEKQGDKNNVFGILYFFPCVFLGGIV